MRDLEWVLSNPPPLFFAGDLNSSALGYQGTIRDVLQSLDLRVRALELLRLDQDPRLLPN